MMSTGASSVDVSEFTDVALSFINMLTEQATETVTIRSCSISRTESDKSRFNPSMVET